MTSSEVKALLSQKYAPPVYAFFTEVANGTGAHQSRYADAIAYALYPSMGNQIEGFEVKVSRQDFLNEMKHPEKASEIMQYCDKWWLVAPKGVAKAEELPKTWGFYEIVNDKFFKRKAAPDLNPIAPPLSFIAALLRRATEGTIPRSTLHDRIKEAREEIKNDYQADIQRANESLESYKKRVEEFEKASGIKVFDYFKSSADIGKAVRFVLDGGLRLEYNIGGAIAQVEGILRKLQEFETVSKEIPKL